MVIWWHMVQCRLSSWLLVVTLIQDPLMLILMLLVLTLPELILVPQARWPQALRDGPEVRGEPTADPGPQVWHPRLGAGLRH